MKTDRTRKLVADALIEVERSAYSSIALDRLIRKAGEGIDVPFATRAFYGTLERRNTLDRVISALSDRPIGKMDREILSILRMGAYQILYMDSVPDYAAVSSSADLCRAFRKNSASGFVNAVLRKVAGFDISSLRFEDEVDRICCLYSMNRGIASILMRDYPDSHEEILKAMFGQMPLTVAVNTTRIAVPRFLDLLRDSGRDAREVFGGCVEIEDPGAVASIPGFSEGFFHVQGLPSFCAVASAGIRPGDTVVDLCAAPGGKTFTADIMTGGSGRIISCDPNPSRLELIRRGAERLGFTNITLKENLGQVYDPSLEGADVVICDVPCSGIGTIPGKPDLRYKDLGDLDSLEALQLDILRTGSRYVRKGGRLVYSTCTLNRGENEGNVTKFLRENGRFRLVDVPVPPGAVRTGGMVCFLPGQERPDGFFFAVLERI